MNDKNEKYIVKFDKEYNFENENYKQIDLSKLEDLKAIDLDKIDKIYQSNGGVPLLAEMSRGYAMLVASEVTGLPKEFFDNLPAKYSIKIKNMISNFFFA